ncbi:achaete-scute complex protein T3-like [Venturia canescens]|uniref:achaete-scute complex protein T3-like n=1 Tax=Venturia canescens TaxID=32260 RepID=UPI001C9D4FA1|nr:achaete-scute complex protein T3-like [Venturia canescens]
MTLVRTLTRNDENALPKMLSVQHQNHHHHHHHSHHASGGLHSNINVISPLSGNNSQSNRSNVIVSTGGLASTNDIKTTLHQQQHQNQQQQQHHQQNNCKRTKMYQSTPYGTVPHQPASVARRNARERNRVKQVNNGFATLRQHIPQSVAQALGGNTAGTHGGSRAGSKKLSKVETLRMAVEYIRSLQRLIDDHDGTDGSSMISSSSPALSTCGSGSVTSSRTSDLLHGDTLHREDLRNKTSDDLHHGMTNTNGRHLRQNGNSPTSFVPPPCSEASSSPTPSFVSEASSAGSQGYGSTSTNGPLYTTHGDSYDNYEPMSPEDEELLDVISWWQQSQ